MINAQPGRALTVGSKLWATIARRNRYGGLYTPEVRELYRLTARVRGFRASALDAVIQMGSDFHIPFPRRFVTYEDMTVPQLVELEGLSDILGAAAIQWWTEGQARCYDAATNCCAGSHWAAESIVSEYGVDPSKVDVVGFGRNYEPRPLARDWTRPRFFFMGHDWERKNGLSVVRAFAELRERVPEARLDVAGGHPRIEVDGVFTHGPLDLTDAGSRAKAESLFETATCFVMPSRFEPFGMVYVEAAAAGVPSIGTTIGGAGDAIGEKGGLLVDPADERALAEAMTALCDPGIASTMGKAALERSHLFTWRAVAERLVRALRIDRATGQEPPGEKADRLDIRGVAARERPDSLRTVTSSKPHE